jgi:tRNA threonylcarbamoyladenosine biosynthesis protein TsaB
MNLLAFDTSTSACSVALIKGDTLLEEHSIAPMQQAALILPMIQALLSRANLSLSALDAIAFGCGPGSFTGIRIASSVAQGISFAYSLPIIQISSLAATAQAAYDAQKWRKLLVAVDARMDQVYWARYEVNQQGLVELREQEKVCSPHAILVLEKEMDWYGVGDGWGPYGETLIKALAFQPREIARLQTATATGVVKLAKAKLEAGQTGVSASDVSPVYLR